MTGVLRALGLPVGVVGDLGGEIRVLRLGTGGGASTSRGSGSPNGFLRKFLGNVDGSVSLAKVSRRLWMIEERRSAREDSGLAPVGEEDMANTLETPPGLLPVAPSMFSPFLNRHQSLCPSPATISPQTGPNHGLTS